MHPNEALINRFYTCFQNKDFQGMQACYADQATFSDAVFIGLNGEEVRAMWEMLCRRGGKDLQVEFDRVSATDTGGRANWTARYTFSATGQKVVNRIQAEFVIEQGKIVRHTDRFSFYAWARQALGITGLLLGWTPTVRNKVRKTARRNLADFMAKKN